MYLSYGKHPIEKTIEIRDDDETRQRVKSGKITFLLCQMIMVVIINP